jgi:hypothetical protein
VLDKGMDQATFRKMKSLLEPCQTPEELDRFLTTWVGISLPWDTVDENSSSSPLKLIWQVNHVFLTNEGPTQHVVMAARNSYKTVDAALIQFISMLHYRRDGAHIASIMDQSLTTIRYIDQYMNIPELLPFRKIDNVRLKQFINLPPNDFTNRHDAVLRVVTATKKGANSPRASCLTLDEVDLTPQNILDEVAFVADPTRGKNRFRPVYVYLSSRKTNNGPIQNLAQKAERQANDPNKRAKLHKWSHADMLERCPPEVHKPEFGIQVAYLNQETLEIIWGHDEFLKQVAASSRAAFSIIQAYEGCKTCPAFIACRGFSVKQRAETTCLRDRQFIGDLLEAIQDPSVVAAQSLNLRPETGGVVFKTFNRAKHVADKIDFYKWVTGEYFRQNGRSDAEIMAIEEEGTEAEISEITPTKVDIYRAMVSADWTIFAGVDFGYDPDPAVCVIGGYHKKTKRVGIINTTQANRYANNAWAEFLEANIFPILRPDWVAPDLADKSSPTYFKKTPALTTKPSRIMTGVSHLRGLLWNPVTQSTTFKILDDSDEFVGALQNATPGKEPGNLMLISAMEHHQHQKVASTGLWDSNKFADDIFTHSIDALRYGLAPVVEDSSLVYGFDNEPTQEELLRDASANPEAHRKLMEANRVEEAIKSFFKEQHGVEGLDLTPSKSRPNEDNENLQAGRKAKLVFSFD